MPTSAFEAATTVRIKAEVLPLMMNLVLSSRAAVIG